MRIAVTFNVRLATSTRQPDDFSLCDDEEEYDSPATIRALAEVLEGLGHEVDLLGDGEPMLWRLLNGPRPDLVLNIAEGSGHLRSREARVPAVLEMLSIPHTGSDPLTLAATLDKDCAKRLVASAGVATPRWVLFNGDLAAVEDQLAALPFPVFVKPAFEGSSKGILASSLIESYADLIAALSQLHTAYHQPVLVEEFIDGDELTVGIVGNHPPTVLGIMRVLPKDPSEGPFVYSLEVKRDWERRVQYECPARLSEEGTAAVNEAALAAWRVLGCRDVSRMDFRLRDGVPYFLEVNPLPGLSPYSGDLVLLARAVGIDYPELISQIIHAACERIEQPVEAV
jgi:D-alanine-D-alanine ligase